ncbi:MAG TPA: hypothetical protein DEF45_19180 [Rhodopirellula sp.]|nr:MAG: hypothetical protein CBD74_11055 [Saprospirales bacterium TMED214]HBV65137.1 hypothetical protein [Rhodopirellula sp.]
MKSRGKPTKQSGTKVTDPKLRSNTIKSASRNAILKWIELRQHKPHRITYHLLRLTGFCSVHRNPFRTFDLRGLKLSCGRPPLSAEKNTLASVLVA